MVVDELLVLGWVGESDQRDVIASQQSLLEGDESLQASDDLPEHRISQAMGEGLVVDRVVAVFSLVLLLIVLFLFMIVLVAVVSWLPRRKDGGGPRVVAAAAVLEAIEDVRVVGAPLRRRQRGGR
jgi:hypothetical protein